MRSPVQSAGGFRSGHFRWEPFSESRRSRCRAARRHHRRGFENRHAWTRRICRESDGTKPACMPRLSPAPHEPFAAAGTAAIGIAVADFRRPSRIVRQDGKLRGHGGFPVQRAVHCNDMSTYCRRTCGVAQHEFLQPGRLPLRQPLFADGFQQRPHSSETSGTPGDMELDHYWPVCLPDCAECTPSTFAGFGPATDTRNSPAGRAASAKSFPFRRRYRCWINSRSWGRNFSTMQACQCFPLLFHLVFAPTTSCATVARNCSLKTSRSRRPPCTVFQHLVIRDRRRPGQEIRPRLKLVVTSSK